MSWFWEISDLESKFWQKAKQDFKNFQSAMGPFRSPFALEMVAGRCHFVGLMIWLSEKTIK